MQPRIMALVGAGMVAKTHVAACIESDLVRLKGIAARSVKSAENLADYAREQSCEKIIAYNSVQSLVDDQEVEAVIVATPPNTRADIIRPLAQAGKHILLEKPVGRNSREAEEIVDICREAHVSLGVVFQHRAREASVLAGDLISKGKLGKLVIAEFDVPWWREQSYYDEPGRGSYERDGGGVLISQAIHTIDLGLSLTGPVKSVTALAATTGFHIMESEDYVVAGLTFENGATGRLTASTASFPGGAESIALHFEKASLRLEAGVLQVQYHDGRVETFGEEAGTGGGADPMAFTHAWHQLIIENFIDALNGEGEIYATGESALSAHNLIDAAISSAKAGKTEYLNK